MKRRKTLALFLLAMLIIIQFFRPAKNTTEIIAANDISKTYHLPASVQRILQTSCYDCHSNNTNYPWYSTIQPVGWWLDDHIQEGKKEVNFSEFAAYRIRKQYKKLGEIIDEVKEDEMPLSSYTVIHRNAILTKDQKSSLINWAAAARNTIRTCTPLPFAVQKGKFYYFVTG